MTGRKNARKKGKKIPWVTMSCGMNGGSEGATVKKRIKYL